MTNQIQTADEAILEALARFERKMDELVGRWVEELRPKWQPPQATGESDADYATRVWREWADRSGLNDPSVLPTTEAKVDAALAENAESAEWTAGMLRTDRQLAPGWERGNPVGWVCTHVSGHEDETEDATYVHPEAFPMESGLGGYAACEAHAEAMGVFAKPNLQLTGNPGELPAAPISGAGEAATSDPYESSEHAAWMRLGRTPTQPKPPSPAELKALQDAADYVNRCGNVDCGPNCTHGLSVMCGHDGECGNDRCKHDVTAAVEAERARLADLGERVVEYMANEMAMPDALSDQEQNWIAGHIHAFAARLTRTGTPAPAAPPKDLQGKRAGQPCGQPFAPANPSPHRVQESAAPIPAPEPAPVPDAPNQCPSCGVFGLRKARVRFVHHWSTQESWVCANCIDTYREACRNRMDILDPIATPPAEPLPEVMIRAAQIDALRYGIETFGYIDGDERLQQRIAELEAEADALRFSAQSVTKWQGATLEIEQRIADLDAAASALRQRGDAGGAK